MCGVRMRMCDTHVYVCAGLMGAIIVNRAGSVAPGADTNTLLPADVDQDAVLFFTVMDEWASIFRYDNVKQ